MEQHKGGFRSIDEYIATFPEDIQALLEAVRATIKAAAPGAEEIISYQMPTFVLNGHLVYFAAWKKHIGFYPASGGVPEAFKEELSRYERTPGTVKFPINQPLPLDLISRIVQFRVAENLNKVAAKPRKKKRELVHIVRHDVSGQRTHSPCHSESSEESRPSRIFLP